jgi:integrase
VAIYAGPRRGELLKLRWANVDFDLNTITFKENKNKQRPLSADGADCSNSAHFRSLPQCRHHGFQVSRSTSYVGTRLADAGVDVVKIKELMGHPSIVTTMRYIHVTDQGKRGAIVVLSEYRQRHCRKFVAKEKRQTVQPAASR